MKLIIYEYKKIIHKHKMEYDELPLYMTYEFSKENTHNDCKTRMKNINPWYEGTFIEYEYCGYLNPRTLINNKIYNKRYTNLHKAINDNLISNDYDAKFERNIKNMPLDQLIDLMEKYKLNKHAEYDKERCSFIITYEFKVTFEIRYNKLFQYKVYPFTDKDSKLKMIVHFPEKRNVIYYNLGMRAKYKNCTLTQLICNSGFDNKIWKKKINRNKGPKHDIKTVFDI
jgi:hypothetical protein